MDIKFKDGHWKILIENEEAEFNCTASNIYDLKSRFMDRMSSAFDCTIRNKCIETDVFNNRC